MLSCLCYLWFQLEGVVSHPLRNGCHSLESVMPYIMLAILRVNTIVPSRVLHMASMSSVQCTQLEPNEDSLLAWREMLAALASGSLTPAANSMLVVCSDKIRNTSYFRMGLSVSMHSRIIDSIAICHGLSQCWAASLVSQCAFQSLPGSLE